jgi:hypothetical protein
MDNVITLGAVIWWIFFVLTIVPLWRIFSRAGIKPILSVPAAFPLHVLNVQFLLKPVIVPLNQPVDQAISWSDRVDPAWLVITALVALSAWFVAKAIKKSGHSPWWALHSLLPFVNLVMLWVFAYAKWNPQHGNQRT